MTSDFSYKLEEAQLIWRGHGF